MGETFVLVSIFPIQLPAQLERISSLVAKKTLHDIFHRSLHWAYHFVYTQAVPTPAVANMAVFIRRREMQPVRRAGADLSTRKSF
jgi:hypothetical protein